MLFMISELESLLPGEDVTPEVSVGGGLLEDGVLQLQVLHNAARPEKDRSSKCKHVFNRLFIPQVKVLLDNVVQLSAALGTGAVVKDGH